MWKQYKPEEIEAKSFAIIRSEMESWQGSIEESWVVLRVIHASADFDFQHTLAFSKDAVTRGMTALQNGATIVSDTNMALAGISKPALAACGGQAVCLMADEDVAVEAKERGVTRAVVAVEKAAERYPNGVFAIGNAPTALLRLIELVRDGVAQPALVIGAPVGFVNVVEAKEELLKTDIPYICARGRKGGSTIAAAICNALLYGKNAPGVR